MVRPAAKLSSVQLVWLLAACAADEHPESSEVADTPSADPATGRIQGVFRSVSGEGLPGARVEAGGVEGETDAAGFFTLEGVPAGETLRLEAQMEGYSTASTRRRVRSGVWTYAELWAVPSQTRSWWPSSDGGEVTLQEVSVAFPDGVARTDGSAADEPVTVTWSLLRELDAVRAAPGDLMANLGDGEAGRLESFGMVEVRLQDAAGWEVQPVGEARLRFPLADSADLQDGQAALLFGFDSEAGLWTGQGEGSVEQGDFVASVSHFSWWSVDAFGDTDQCVTGTLLLDGDPLAGAWIRVLEAETLTTGLFETDAAGGFRIEVPRGAVISLELTYGLGTWAAGPIAVPSSSASEVGCLDLGEMEAVSVDLDEDGFASEASGGPDCEDLDPLVHPGAEEAWYDGVDQDCDGNDADQDTDGYAWDAYPYTLPETLEAGDCDDEDAGAHPGAAEDCGDTSDWNCDGRIVPATETECVDEDGDGADTAEDCDDADPDAYPGADERCDGKDNDCDLSTDEETVDTPAWYPDLDGDGYGDTSASAVLSCEPPPGHVADAADCDDEDERISPGEPDDQCDRIDDDCDGVADGDAWIVAPAGTATGHDFDNLQDAIDVAISGETICVSPGTYEGVTVWEDEDLSIISTEGQEMTILEGGGAGPVLILSGLGEDSLLRGFTVTGGEADWGGGLYISNASPTLSDLSVSGNTASDGGGVFLSASWPVFDDVTIDGNLAEGSGGGMLMNRSSPDLSEVTVLANTATINGGGMFCYISSPQLYEVSVAGNASGADGGGIYFAYSEATLTSVTVAGNSAGAEGGGLALLETELGISNVIISHNQASSGGGLYRPGTEEVESTLAATWSDVWGNAPDESVGLTFSAGEAGNLAVDPDYVYLDLDEDSYLWDLRLAAGSPLIDAGDPASLDDDGTVSDIGAW